MTVVVTHRRGQKNDDHPERMTLPTHAPGASMTLKTSCNHCYMIQPPYHQHRRHSSPWVCRRYHTCLNRTLVSKWIPNHCPVPRADGRPAHNAALAAALERCVRVREKCGVLTHARKRAQRRTRTFFAGGPSRFTESAHSLICSERRAVRQRSVDWDGRWWARRLEVGDRRKL